MATDPAALVPFTFRGDALDVVRLADGDVGLPLRRLCEVLGLDANGQVQRLARLADAGARWACTCVMHAQVAGQGREVVVLPRRSIPMWAATVDASRVAPEVRSKLVAYQDEAAEALAAAFLDAPAAKGQLPLFPPERRSTLASLAATMGEAALAGDTESFRVLHRAMGRLSTPSAEATRAKADEWDRRVGAFLRALPAGARPTICEIAQGALGLASPSHSDFTRVGTSARVAGWIRLQVRIGSARRWVYAAPSLSATKPAGEILQ